MTVKINFSWDRYGLIAELTDRLGDNCPQFGKTMLQKLVYLLQQLYNIPVGYHFELYTYGPFTSQLLQDLDLVEAIGGVNVLPIAEGAGGYKITPGKNMDQIKRKANSFLQNDKNKAAFSDLIQKFGCLTAKRLELLSTIVYVNNDLAKAGEKPTYKDIINVVKQIKPKFSEVEIGEAISQLSSLTDS